jgi:ZIP family zinc transporter
MNDFFLVLGIASVAALLTYLGAPAAERFEAPHRVVSGALQFAAGIIAALVALSLMPPAVRAGSSLALTLSFFTGGALFVAIEYFSTQYLAARAPGGSQVRSLGLYIGILIDLLIDGVVIGVGATLTLGTGLLLAIGMSISTAPLAFVTTTTARRQGVSRERRRLLGYLYFLCVLAGAMLGYTLVRNQAEAVRVILIALASGFLITTVTQGLIPEANREGEPGFAGILFVGGMSLYALLTLAVK